MRLVILSLLVAAVSASAGYIGSPAVVSYGGLGGYGAYGGLGYGLGYGGWGNGGWGNGGWGHGGWGNGGWGNGGWGNSYSGYSHAPLSYGYTSVVKAAPVIVKAPLATSYAVSSPYYGGYGAGVGSGYWGGWGGHGHAATSYQNVYKVSKPLYSGLGSLGYGHAYGYGSGYGYGHGW